MLWRYLFTSPACIFVTAKYFILVVCNGRHRLRIMGSIVSARGEGVFPSYMPKC